jgi:hypothetical protein
MENHPANFVHWFNETTRLYEYGVLNENNKNMFIRFIINNTESIRHCFTNPIITWLQMFLKIKNVITSGVASLTDDMRNWIYSQDLTPSRVASDVWKQFIMTQPYSTFFDTMVTKEEILNKIEHIHGHNCIGTDLWNFIIYNTICHNANIFHMKNYELWALWDNFMKSTTYETRIEKFVYYRVNNIYNGNPKHISVMHCLMKFRIKLGDIEHDIINKRNTSQVNRFIQYNEDAYRYCRGKMNMLAHRSIWEEFIRRPPYLYLITNRCERKRKHFENSLIKPNKRIKAKKSTENEQEKEQLQSQQQDLPAKDGLFDDAELADFLDGVF